MSEWIKCSDQLPPDNTYVLVHYAGKNYRDSHHQFGCECRVMKFVRGLSVEQRKKLPKNHHDKNAYSFADEWGNNKNAYAWEEFGPSKYYSQDVDYWMPLPERS